MTLVGHLETLVQTIQHLLLLMETGQGTMALRPSTAIRTNLNRGI
ncbi:MAG TPA: hypothetical protein VK189_00505 [Thermoplasmata archaeon]|nr:hypothetical protein [Thermoplasmata archaeon]